MQELVRDESSVLIKYPESIQCSGCKYGTKVVITDMNDNHEDLYMCEQKHRPVDPHNCKHKELYLEDN